MPVSYLIGTLPFAYVAGRMLKQVDIRTVGDKNAATANINRNTGSRAAAVRLGADIGKRALTILIAQSVGSSQMVVFLCGFGVVARASSPSPAVNTSYP